MPSRRALVPLCSRPACTCYGRFARCPACQASQPPRPETRGRPATTQDAILAAMQPPGTWHRTADLARVVQRVPEQVHTILASLAHQGKVTRRRPGRWYEYTLITTEEP